MADDIVLATDFDGVLNSYTTPFADSAKIPDPPVPGAIEWLEEMARHFFVVIFSVRANDEEGRQAIYEWLVDQGVSPETIEKIEVTAEKPNAQMYLDDRGRHFSGPGTFPTVEEVMAFKPWNR